MCGISKDLLLGYVFLSLFLHTVFYIAARIPLLPPSGAPSPRERALGRSRASATNEFRRKSNETSYHPGTGHHGKSGSGL